MTGAIINHYDVFYTILLDDGNISEPYISVLGVSKTEAEVRVRNLSKDTDVYSAWYETSEGY